MMRDLLRIATILIMTQKRCGCYYFWHTHNWILFLSQEEYVVTPTLPEMSVNEFQQHGEEVIKVSILYTAVWERVGLVGQSSDAC